VHTCARGVALKAAAAVPGVLHCTSTGQCKQRSAARRPRSHASKLPLEDLVAVCHALVHARQLRGGGRARELPKVRPQRGPLAEARRAVRGPEELRRLLVHLCVRG